MPKICDPPPFSGGQCPVFYTFDFELWRRHKDLGWSFTTGTIGKSSAYPPLGAIQGDATSVSANSVQFAIRTAHTRYSVGGYYGLGGISYSQSWLYTDAKVVLKNIKRRDDKPDNCGDLPPTNCRCTPDSCRVDCATAPDGFCCIDHVVTDRLLQVLSQ